MNTKKQIGRRIKEIRKAKNLSQEKLAEKADISSQYLSRIEIGMENPTLDLFMKLADALEIEMLEIFDFGHSLNNKEIRQIMGRFARTASPENLRLAMKLLKAITR